MKLQTTANLRGEVTFRKLLARQHVNGEILLPDYYGKEDHDKIIMERVDVTVRDMERLKNQGIRLSPFVELGAERCHRSLVLTNDFGADGISVDISLDQLRTAEHFADLLGRPRLPLRVCCDATQLPIRDCAVSFVFSYEFLHHFPAVKPVLQQVHRILSQGTFFFNEEPFKRPRIKLYRQKHKVYSKSALRQNRLISAMERFISEPWSDEIDHGIIENEQITVREWLEALTLFDRRSVVLTSIGGRITSKLTDRIRWVNRPNIFLGGGISGVCAKVSATGSGERNRLSDLLLCPNCLAVKGAANSLPPLISLGDKLRCSVCNSVYPVIDGVVLLLRTELFRELYPEYII